MKYKIEIWTYGYVRDSYESDDVLEVLNWYKDSGWYGTYENGGCSYEIYKDGEMLSFDEEYELGFN